mmetsp:Transcript_38073/g.94415  ORF Transcript_38073/g.94415 Transcript_38073/m.94415 type:complete len:288 (+) Transcript_38073:107-970(+)|eukprot:CAMPEP_0197613334 /NCGR_PEP_ID=MMETSP1326-20131121/58967_1 /TAXON_ID=1155430 /ORGANISM="Genus nov. species nov., Strain RCC2288" /LENGTH=287 /DNA_ID=CAMNT_0043182193 /DNA_START=105 /DNA_END=968 /DNA_ORIENTATION=-
MGCGASSPADAAATPVKPAAAPAAAAKPAADVYVPISQQAAVVALPEIKSASSASGGLGALPDIKKASAKTQSALDAEMDAVLNAGSVVALKDEQHKEAKEIFKRYDVNGSGKLESGELHSVLQKLGLDIPEASFQAYATVLMEQYDKDKSGTLEFREFEKFYAKCLASEEVRAKYAKKLAKEAGGAALDAAAKAAFAKFDVDGSGSIDVAELRNLLHDMLRLELTDEQWAFFAEDTLKRGDKNGDGRFDLEEFLNLYKKTLADDAVRGKFEEKIMLRYQNGEWTVS